MQRLTCVGITGAQKIAPTANLEALLNLTLLNIHLDGEESIAMLIELQQKKNWKETTLLNIIVC